MDEQDEILLAFLKGLVGSAANLALPGLGSLISVGFSRIQGNGGEIDPDREIARELLLSFKSVAPTEKAPKRVRLLNALRKIGKKDATRFLDSRVDLSSLMDIATRAGEQRGAIDMSDLPKEEQGEWEALGKAQLAMVSSPSFVPGVWQDEFAALLQIVCEEQLKEGGADRDHWRRLLGVEGEKDPDDAQLKEQLRTVSRVFAARMEANSTLQKFAKQLRQSDRTAMQYALLHRLDQQRQSLQLIAAVLVAFAAALGIGLDVE